MRIKPANERLSWPTHKPPCPNHIALHVGQKGVHPAEIGALASVFEKSATELKQKLLKCKRTIQIVTFNIRRCRDELISDVLLWSPSHGRAKAGRPARTYIQQVCAITGCSPEDLPEAMGDREGWQERVRDVHADGTMWWWWWWGF